MAYPVFAVSVSHSVAAKFVNPYPFCVQQKGYFFMKKNFFPRLSVKDICTLGLLFAITVVLAVFGTFRIGDAVKIPTKFISVFVTAAIYGPVWGGMCAATGDLLNAVLAPVGAMLPQITLVEFVSGFAYGLFFIKSGEYSKPDFALRVTGCVLAQFCVDMVLTTAVLTYWVGYFPQFKTAFLFRLPAGLVKAVLQLMLIMPCRGLIERIKKTAYGK